MDDFWMFIAALAVAYTIPGPDMVLVLQAGSTQGRRHAFAVALGLATARATHVALAGLGLAALLRTMPWAFNIVRFAGSAYLIWLAVVIVRASGPAVSEGQGRADSYRDALRRGVLTNLLNPKALLFCSVLLPQFIRQQDGGLSGQFLLLGGVLVGVGMAFDAVYAGAGTWFSRWTGFGAAQRWGFAALLAGFGIHLALVGLG